MKGQMKEKSFAYVIKVKKKTFCLRHQSEKENAESLEQYQH